MKLYVHSFDSSKNGEVSYSGLLTIDEVKEVVIYNEKGNIVKVCTDKDFESVAILARTTCAYKKNQKYFCATVFFDVENAQTVDGLNNGHNYVKCDGKWYMFDEEGYSLKEV